MTETELKLEIFDILEAQDQLQLQFAELGKIKDEKVKALDSFRKAEQKDQEKSTKLEIFDLLEQQDLVKLKFSDLNTKKEEKYKELTKLRKGE